MRKPIRILIAFGTRPEAVKMAPVIKVFQSDPDFEVITLSTAQHREMLDQVIDLFKIPIDYDLDIMRNKQTLEELTTRILAASAPLIADARPEAVLVHGDTTTSFSVALAAFYAQIPVGHIEAGLRSHERYSPFPEEINRKLVSALATCHYAPTDLNRSNLLQEGIDSSSIHTTGNTVIDALLSIVNPQYHFASQQLRSIDFTLGRIVGLTCHRRENLGEPLERIFSAVRDLVEAHPDVQVVYPVHKNPVIKQTALQILGERERIHLIEPLNYADFSNLIARSTFMLTDSGGIQEEAPALNVPVLVLREVTERPEAVDAGCSALVGTTYGGVHAASEALLGDSLLYERMSRAVNPYGDGHAASRIHAALRATFGLD